MQDSRTQVEIYTDGACSPNPGNGGWGAILIMGEYRRELSGAETETTNNRMELLAAIRALQALKRPCSVELHTDSSYHKNVCPRVLSRCSNRQGNIELAAVLTDSLLHPYIRGPKSDFFIMFYIFFKDSWSAGRLR